MLRAILIALMMFAAAAASADKKDDAVQGMKPLSEIFANAASQYAPQRCAGLYQALMEWTGKDRMNEEAWEAMDAARESLIVTSIRIAQAANSGTMEHHLKLAVRDVLNIADLYLTRMETNYALSGHAFYEDVVIKSDAMFCKSIAEGMQ